MCLISLQLWSMAEFLSQTRIILEGQQPSQAQWAPWAALSSPVDSPCGLLHPLPFLAEASFPTDVSMVIPLPPAGNVTQAGQELTR